MKADAEELELRYRRMSLYEDTEYLNGASLICGIDEAGRGPLAGPVVAAACILDRDLPVPGVNDSKKLSAAQREYLYDKIINNCISWSVKEIDNETIDKINILNATKEAMMRCISALKVRPDVILIDAVDLKQTGIRTLPIIKGDSLSVSIAAASIIAKVTRDRIMIEMDSVYPGYGFAKHKGYGTKEHYSAIERLGITDIHRKTFIK